MEFDVDTHLTAVHRSVAFLERDGIAAGAVTLSRSFEAEAGQLWEALTNPDQIPLWAAPIEGDLSLGGRYQIEGNAGGSITVCQPLSHFSLTWEFAGDVSWVDVAFSAEGTSGARLTLTHTALLSEHWDQYGPGAVGVGWELALLGLSLYLHQPGWLKPDEEAFVLSRNGTAFITGSSEGWRQAAIEAGTNPATAAAAARSTTAFYTGQTAEPE